jgi:2-epi-5-epi-valiolone synthase
VDFGHTFSPAIEALSGYRVPHGLAVAIDMLLSVAVAVRLGFADPELLARLAILLQKLGLAISPDLICNSDVLLTAADDTKRHRAGSLNLVVVEAPGRPLFVQHVSRSDLDWACQAIITILERHARTARLGVAHDARSAV